jgi:hypothetical protein
LRSVLAGDKLGPQRDFLAYLRCIPPGKAIPFPRSTDLPRTIEI